ncbi:hypothetical protein PENSPDRAFT_611488 [Peniophora sp. CONT]|nr:hypothetical protein PENSPDRAFT_611488 [Peniophora sp. CONT]
MSKTLEDDLFFDSDLSSLSDDSEQDELEQDEEPAAPPPTASSSKTPAKKATPARKPGPARSKQSGPKGYVVQDCLRPPRTTQLSVRSLHEQIVNGTVDLDPDYQRDVVWTETKQIGVIDSIFRNFYVPPVIFAVSFADDGSETKTCIDGKQRLTSIRKRTGKKYWYRKATSSTRLVLPKNMQQVFDNKQITCMEYGDLSDDQEREIFQRVQLGVALTPAGKSIPCSERMQAITGPRANFVRKMMDDALGADGFGESLDWGRARGRDFQGLASIIFLIEHLPAYKTPASLTLESWLNKQDALSDKIQEDIESTLKIFHALTTNAKLSKVFHQPVRVSPVEFVFIGVLVHMHKAKLSLTQLSSAIDAMRADVRKGFSDIRTNTKVSKRLYSFIKEKIPKGRYTGDGKGDQPASKAVPLLPKATQKKRKREIESDSEEEGSSSEEEYLGKTKAIAKSKASTGEANGKTRASGSKPSAASTSKSSANVKKESPAPPPKSAKKPKVEPPVYAASSKPGRINTSASAGPSTSASALKKSHGVSSSVKHEPESPLVASGSFPKPGPASSKRAAAAKAERVRAASGNEVAKQSASPMSSVPSTPVVSQPDAPPQLPGGADPVAMMNFLMASGFINPAAIANAMNAPNASLPMMGSQPNFANGSAQGVTPGAGQPGIFNMPTGAPPASHAMPPFAPNLPQPHVDTQPPAPPASSVPVYHSAASSQAPQTTSSAPPASSSAPPLRPSASSPAIVHGAGRPTSPSHSRHPPTMPASMMAARQPSVAEASLPPKPQTAPPFPPDDVLSGSPEISRRPSNGSFPSSATFPPAPYPPSASPTNSSFSGRGYDHNNQWARGPPRDRDHYQDRGGRYDPRDPRGNSYRDERRGSGQYGYRSDYNRDSGWR